MKANRPRREWDLSQEQIDRLREVTPDSIELFMAGLNGMSSQFTSALNVLREEIDTLKLQNDVLKQDIEHLRKEVADMRTMAVMIQALIGRSK